MMVVELMTMNRSGGEGEVLFYCDVCLLEMGTLKQRRVEWQEGWIVVEVCGIEPKSE